jgi:hypothetical protein
LQVLEKAPLLDVCPQGRQGVNHATQSIDDAVEEKVDKEKGGSYAHRPFNDGKKLAWQQEHNEGEDKDQPNPDGLSGVKEDKSVFAFNKEQQSEKWGQIADWGQNSAGINPLHTGPS